MSRPTPGAEFDSDGNLVLRGETRDQLEALNPRAVADYRTYKKKFVNWLAHRGKNPARRKGYAENTVKQTSEKTDFIYRWKWEDEGRYTREFTPQDANQFIMEMDWSEGYADSTLHLFVKIIKRMFKFENDVHGAGVEWECPIELSQSTSSNRDHFRKPEFQQLYEASLSHGTVKHYHSCTPEERDRLKAALAQRYDKPKTEVTPEDFERANGWKIPSLISVSLDVGFRPIEVGRANIRWFLPILSGNYELDIPKEESTKNENNWRPVVSQRTARAVRLWLDERDSYEKYRETDAMWLTRFGNPYDSNSLNKLLDRLETEAKIDPRGRSLSWYSIRHGVATIWANDVGLHHAREQLRHNSVETTMRYVRSTPDARGEVINGLW